MQKKRRMDTTMGSATRISQEGAAGIVRSFICERFLHQTNSNELAGTTQLMDRGIIDSVGMLELVSFLEDHFGITVYDEEFIPENLNSVNGISRYVAFKTGHAN
jgi:acyl carrier protein